MVLQSKLPARLILPYYLITLTSNVLISAHGKFRPTLPSLISSNPAQTVTKTTKAAFAYYRGFTNGSDDRVMDNLKDSLKELCKLRGVGPATASLLLSIYKPSVATFLSDEQWRWVCWDETEGWKKKIRYTLNEWVELILAVVELRERLAVDAAGVEKVAYVIGRFAENEFLEREVRELAGQVMEETGAEGRTSIEERAETIMEIPEVKETMIRDLEKAEARRKSQADSEAGKSTTANGEKELGEVDAPPIVGRTAADKFGNVEARTQDDESKDQAASSAKKVSAPTRSRKATDPVTDVEPPRKRLRQRKSTGH